MAGAEETRAPAGPSGLGESDVGPLPWWRRRRRSRSRRLWLSPPQQGPALPLPRVPRSEHPGQRPPPPAPGRRHLPSPPRPGPGPPPRGRLSANERAGPRRSPSMERGAGGGAQKGEVQGGACKRGGARRGGRRGGRAGRGREDWAGRGSFRPHPCPTSGAGAPEAGAAEGPCARTSRAGTRKALGLGGVRPCPPRRVHARSPARTRN